MVFPNSVLLGQNLAEILFLLWLAFWTKKLQKYNWKRIPYGIAEKNSKKTQRLTHLWPKARSSFFSEWTVGGGLKSTRGEISTRVKRNASLKRAIHFMHMAG